MEKNIEIDTKWVKDTITEVLKIANKWVDQNEVEHLELKTEVTEEPIELESINEPLNPDIINIKFTVPSGRKKQLNNDFIDFSKLFSK